MKEDYIPITTLERKWDGSGGRLTLYRSLHCHHQNGSCIKVGSDESHFNVSLIVRDSHETASTTFLTEEKGLRKWTRGKNWGNGSRKGMTVGRGL